MAIRIGTNPIAWSNDDLPELGGETPLEVCLAEASRAGYSGIELGNKFPREPAALRAALAPFSLACVSGWYSGRLLERDAAAELEAMGPHLDLLTSQGCALLIFADTSRGVHGDRAAPLSRRPVLTSEEWTRFCTRLDEVAEGCAARGLTVAYHHHMGTFVQTEEDVDRLVASTSPRVGLLVDSGHLAFAGADPVAVARRHGERVVHVHNKDVRPEVLQAALLDDLSFLDAVLRGVFTVPGDGCLDFPALWRSLAERGYRDGWAIVEAEQDPARAPPFAYAERGYRALRQAIVSAGLEVDEAT